MTQFAMLGGKKLKNLFLQETKIKVQEKSKEAKLILKKPSMTKEIKKKDMAQYEEAPLNVQFVWLCFSSLNEVYTNFSP